MTTMTTHTARIAALTGLASAKETYRHASAVSDAVAATGSNEDYLAAMAADRAAAAAVEAAQAVVDRLNGGVAWGWGPPAKRA